MNRKQRRAGPKATPSADLLAQAVQFHQSGRLDQAERLYREILAADSRHADALHLSGVVALQTGRHDRAAELIGKAIGVNPYLPHFHSNHGIALKELGRLDEALASYDTALRLSPTDADALSNRGNVLRSLGRLDEALASFTAALRLQPDQVQALYNRGLVQYDLGRLDEARTSYEFALCLKPDYAEAHTNRGNVFYDFGQIGKAIAAHRTALRCRPDYAEATSDLIPCLQQVCAWDDVPDHGGKIQPFTLLALDSTAEQQLAIAKRHAGTLARSIQALPRRAPRGDGKIRLGYLSGDFRQHPVAHLVVELIERHDRERFEVTGYSYGPDDGSAIQRRLIAGFDRFTDIRSLNHAEAARLIHGDHIDILVDLTGYTHGARTQILAFRPAPVQVNFLGYPGTMGADFIDYIVADPVVIPPDHEAFFSETVIRLPDCYQPNDRQREISAETPSRAAAGLPGQGFVFCCFNNSFKITPALFAVWMRLLAKVPGSVLWLLDGNDTLKGNLRREAAKAGVAPERLVFAPRLKLPDHLARHRLADLFLDTLPYNAHTTASDALWAGLPVLTCRGGTFAGRVAASLLTAVGMPELIASSLEDYEAMALALTIDTPRLAGLRQKLADNRDAAPLFDTGRFARNLEDAYRRIAQ